MLTWLCRVFSFAPLELMKNEDGIDVHYERAAAEGAAIVRPLADNRMELARVHRAGYRGESLELRHVPAGRRLTLACCRCDRSRCCGREASGQTVAILACTSDGRSNPASCQWRSR